ncbi:MAG: hypothetical protein AAGA12_13950 [Pseudomonadota bacterium]
MNRNYRRIVLFALGIAVFGSVILSDLADTDQYWLGLVFLVLLACSGAFVAMLIVATRPAWRRLLEIAGASGLLATIVYGLFPGPGEGIILASLAGFVMIFMAIKIYFDSELARFSGRNKTIVLRNSIDLPFDAEDIWHFAIPGMAGPVGQVMGFAAKFTADPEDADTVKVTYDGGRAEYEIVFLTREEPTYCRYYFFGSDADGVIVDGVAEIGLVRIEEGIYHVTSQEERTGQPLGAAVERWFDNPLSAAHTHLRQQLERHTFPNVPDAAALDGSTA